MLRLKQTIDNFPKKWYIIITEGENKTPKKLKGQPKSKKRRKVQAMTKREFLNDIISGNISEDTIAHAAAELEKLDATNAKRRENPKPTKESIAAAERREQALNWLKSNEGEFDLAAIAEGTGLTTGQVPAALKSAVADGVVAKSTVKVDSKRTKTVYKYIGA